MMKFSLPELLIILIPVVVIATFVIVYLRIRPKRHLKSTVNGKVIDEEKCTICGSPHQKNDLTCGHCGSQLISSTISSENKPPEQSKLDPIVSEKDEPVKNNSLAVLSVIVGIIALGTIWLIGGDWSSCIGSIGMIFGAVSLIQIKRRGETKKTLSIIGIVLGILPFIITVCSVMVVLLTAPN